MRNTAPRTVGPWLSPGKPHAAKQDSGWEDWSSGSGARGHPTTARRGPISVFSQVKGYGGGHEDLCPWKGGDFSCGILAANANPCPSRLTRGVGPLKRAAGGLR